MELTTQADIYEPSIDNSGNYIDKIPSFNNLKDGIQCLCGTRKDKKFDSKSTFTTHTKTQTHIKWLENLNLNKKNYYVESENLKKTVRDQRKIIGDLDKISQNKSVTISILTEQLVLSRNTNTKTEDLLSFD